MTPEFVRCDYCRAEVPSAGCQLAAYSTVIEGKQYIFCCQQCAERYKKGKTRKKKD